jgi:hypothetical protein
MTGLLTLILLLHPARGHPPPPTVTTATDRQPAVADPIVGVGACAMTEAIVGSSFASAVSQVSLLRSSPYPHEAHGNLDLPVYARRRVKPSS